MNLQAFRSAGLGRKDDSRVFTHAVRCAGKQQSVFCKDFRATLSNVIKIPNGQMKSAKEKQFEELVKQYKRTIYSVCYMFSRDNEEINDLFQEILVRLWLGFDQFEQRSSLSTWVYRIALNTAINSDKRAKRRPQTVPLSTDIDPYDPQDSSFEQVRQLYALINQLDVMDRGLVLLWLEGIGYDEIAAIMGITVANVGIKLHRIKEKLVQKSKSVTH